MPLLWQQTRDTNKLAVTIKVPEWVGAQQSQSYTPRSEQNRTVTLPPTGSSPSRPQSATPRREQTQNLTYREARAQSNDAVAKEQNLDLEDPDIEETQLPEETLLPKKLTPAARLLASSPNRLPSSPIALARQGEFPIGLARQRHRIYQSR